MMCDNVIAIGPISLRVADWWRTFEGVNELQRLKAGMPITDIGNHRVGNVAAVEDDAFKMDILNDGSIWLREDSLFWVGVHSAVLICARNGVERYAT